MFYTNKPCILTSQSLDGQRVYFDGQGWTLRQENAAVYQNFDFADEHRELLEASPVQPPITVEYSI